MSWQFEYLDAKDTPTSIDVEVEFTEFDEAGKTGNKISRGYSFRRDDCPSRAELDGIIMSDLAKLSEMNKRTVDILGAVGSTKALNKDILSRSEPMDVSQTDKQLLSIKAKCKPYLIECIHRQPDCTFDGLSRYVSARMEYKDEVVRGLIHVLFYLYITQVFKEGLITDTNFEALRDFIATKSVEELTLL